jgi:hypothetical protein
MLLALTCIDSHLLLVSIIHRSMSERRSLACMMLLAQRTKVVDRMIIVAVYVVNVSSLQGASVRMGI